MSSIPLPALRVNPPEQQNTLSTLQALVQMRGQQQAQQMNAVNLQNAQMQQQDQIKLRQLFIQHQGNIDKVLADAPNAGVSPQTIQGLQLHAIDVKTKTADLVAKQGANAATQADLMQGAHDAVAQAPAEQKAAEYQRQLQGLQQRGVDVSQMPPQYPGDDQFKLLGAVVKGHKQQIEDALKASEQNKNASQAGAAGAEQKKTEAAIPGVAAEGQIKQAEAGMLSQGGITPQMAESKYLGLQTRAKQGFPISPPDKAFMAAYEKNKTLVPTANFNLQNAIPQGQNGQPSALAQAVAARQMKWGDVISPRTPMAVKEAFAKEVKSIDPSFNSGDFSIEQGVRKDFTSGKSAQTLNAFTTATEHLKLLGQLSDSLDNGNMPLVNNIANKFKSATGSAAPTNFNMAKNAVAGEIAKTFKGNATEGEISSINETINNAQSPAQLKGAINTALSLMGSKREALQQQYESGKHGKSTLDNAGVTVTAPNGKSYSFPDQASADAFKAKAGIK